MGDNFKKMARREQWEYGESWGELTQHFKILVEGGGVLANSTPREGGRQGELSAKS